MRIEPEIKILLQVRDDLLRQIETLKNQLFGIDFAIQEMERIEEVKESKEKG